MSNSGDTAQALWLCSMSVSVLGHVICTIVLIAIGGVTLHYEHKGIDNFTDFSVGGFAIAIGVIIIFTYAFFHGCCLLGVIKENECIIKMYCIVMGLALLILRITLGALALNAVKNNNGSLDKEVKDVVQIAFDKYLKDQNNGENKKIIDEIQQSFECCGIDNSSDWLKKYNVKIPDSCYEDLYKKDGNLFNTGCAEAFQDFMTYHIGNIGGVAIGFAVLDILLSCCVGYSMK